MARRGMRAYVVTLSAGVERKLNVEGDYFHILEADAAVQLSFDEDKYLTLARGVGGSFTYESIRFLSDTSQSVTVVLGFGTFADYRATVNATVNSTIEPATQNTELPEVTVPAGNSAKIADANADRKELRVSIKSTAPGGVYLGSATIANHTGGWLEPGMVDYIATEAEVWAYNPGADDVVVSSLDLERP